MKGCRLHPHVLLGSKCFDKLPPRQRCEQSDADCNSSPPSIQSMRERGQLRSFLLSGFNPRFDGRGKGLELFFVSCVPRVEGVTISGITTDIFQASDIPLVNVGWENVLELLSQQCAQAILCCTPCAFGEGDSAFRTNAHSVLAAWHSLQRDEEIQFGAMPCKEGTSGAKWWRRKVHLLCM